MGAAAGDRSLKLLIQTQLPSAPREERVVRREEVRVGDLALRREQLRLADRRPELPPEEAWAAVDAAKKEGALTGAFYAEDMFGRPVLLFRNAYTVERLENDADLDLGLQPWALPPATAP